MTSAKGGTLIMRNILRICAFPFRLLFHILIFCTIIIISFFWNVLFKKNSY